MKKSGKNFDSFCVKENEDQKTTKPHQLPLYATSSFEFNSTQEGIDIFTGKESGHVYSRYGNPTIDTVADKLAQLEVFGSDIEAFGYLTSSGMSAISTVLMALLKSGDKILTQGNLYGGTTELMLKIFGRMGVEPIFTNLQNLAEVKENLAQNPEIKVIYAETPANPTLACIDLEQISNIAKENDVLTVVDNTFCTPFNQQPILLGIDFVIHSTTKYLNGHGNSIAGVIIGKKDHYQKEIWTALKLAGTNCNPWDAWLINNGLKTLAIRMKKHNSNALAIALYLDSHKKITKVNYTGLTSHPDHELAKKQMKGFGGMVSFEIEGGMESAIKFLDTLEFCTIAPTLGDVDTLVLHPATSSHLNVDKKLREENGITDGLIRISVGIENPLDIIQDIENALVKI